MRKQSQQGEGSFLFMSEYNLSRGIRDCKYFPFSFPYLIAYSLLNAGNEQFSRAMIVKNN